MTQFMVDPGLVEDTQLIEEMRAYELKKLNPGDLNGKQLIAAFRCTELFGLLQLAFDMLLEPKNRDKD